MTSGGAAPGAAAAPGQGAAAPGPAAADHRGFALYVHWPFCRSKCPYCDFNSHVRGSVDQDRWRAALLAELDHFAAETAGRRLDSIFFGGGTPSLMPPETVAAVIDRATAHWAAAPGLEVTLEANPTSVEAERFAGFRAAGVNRVSLGVQALDDADLAFLGREHSAAEALAAVGVARRHFDRFSFDLIYARPGQTPEAWAAELGRALDHAVGHLSVYQLTIERGTKFEGMVRRGDFAPPDDEAAAALWDATQETLDAAGLPAYEVSNHARPGEECRHNLVYWRTGDYVGIGPGAHGRLTRDGDRLALRTHRAPEAWLERVERQGHGEQPRAGVDPTARAEEALMMGLRLAEGVPLARIAADAGRPWDAVLDRAAIDRLTAAGFLTLAEGRLAATAEGRPRLDGLIARVLA